MIILRPHEYRVLAPQRRLEWLTPSLAQPKTVFGHENCVRFRLTARLNDGHIAWRGYFNDREDADAFLWALARLQVLGEPVPRELWDLPTPNWFPGFGEGLSYEFATQIFIVSGTSQTSPSDWNNSNNTVEGLGGGGSGAVSHASTTNVATGGGGGEYRKISNFSVATPGTTAFNYTIGAGGNGVSRSSSGTTNGNDGTQVTFNTSSLIAKPGLHGIAGANPQNGGTGGTGGTGAAGNFDGGRGGNSGANNSVMTGGGGAAGPNGAGTNGTDPAFGNGASAGGQGDSTFGGTGTSGVSGSSSTSSNGNAGTEFGDSTHGAGGASGAARSTGAANNATSGTGGAYGAGTGGAACTSGSATGTAASGTAGQGIIWLTYTPSAGTANYMFNIAFPH